MVLFVGNLPAAATAHDLKELFAAFGKVTACHVVVDKFSGLCRGFGFVTMSDRDEGVHAVAGVDQCEFGGHRLRVAESVKRPHGREAKEQEPYE